MNRDLTTDEVVAVIVGIFLAATVLPAMIPAMGARAGAWLIEHSILLEPAQSMVVFPGFAAGADIRRLIIFAAFFAALALAGWIRWRTRRAQEQPS